MPWWLWIFAIPVGLVLLFIAATHLDRALSGLKSDVILHGQRGEKTGRLIIYLPGILAHGDDSSRSLIDTWLRHGDVLTVSYVGERFDAAGVAKTVVRRLQNDLEHNQFVFVGSSMGGLLAVDIVDQMRLNPNREVLVSSSFVLIDSPSGSKDMLSGGNIGAPVMRLLPFGRMFNKLGAPLMRAMLVPPKDENIEAHLDHDGIKSQAIEDMGKYPLSVWRDQLAYMAAHPALRPSSFAGLNRLVYLRCDRNNETVQQPQAANRWARVSRELRIIGVDSTHCGYLERPMTWNQHFEQVLQDMTVSH